MTEVAMGPRVPGVQVSAIGDSHTNSGIYLAEAHVRLGARDMSGMAIGLIGHGAKVIARHLPEVLATRPTHVIVQAGVNDIASGRSLNHVKRWLSAMYREIRAAEAQVIAIPVLPWARYLDQPRLKAHKRTFLRRTRSLNAWIAAEHAAGRIDAVVDVAPLRDSTGGLNRRYALRDGLHLNGKGQKALGRLVADAVRRTKNVKQNVPKPVAGGSLELRRIGASDEPHAYPAQPLLPGARSDLPVPLRR